MFTAVIIVIFSVAAIQASPKDSLRHGGILHSMVRSIDRNFDVLEGAPKPPGGRIVNGDTAAHGQFPHQVALYLDGYGFCGGSLISTRWVLTAAHCAQGINSFSVYLGSQSLNVNENERVIINTVNKIVHSGYNPSTLNNDVALLDLGRDVELSPYIQIIQLATGSNTYVNTVARVSGWGKTSDTGGVSNTLQYADLDIMENAQCRQVYGSIIVSSTICASTSSGRSTCNGDSGGPLVDPGSGRQIGVVSFGALAGCTLGYPVGFARVTYFAPWISSNTGIVL